MLGLHFQVLHVSCILPRRFTFSGGVATLGLYWPSRFGLYPSHHHKRKSFNLSYKYLSYKSPYIMGPWYLMTLNQFSFNVCALPTVFQTEWGQEVTCFLWVGPTWNHCSSMNARNSSGHILVDIIHLGTEDQPNRSKTAQARIQVFFLGARKPPPTAVCNIFFYIQIHRC